MDGTNDPSDQQYDTFAIPYETAFALFVTAAVLACCCCCCMVNLLAEDHPNRVSVGYPSILFLFIGMVMLAIYSRRMAPIVNHEYEGLMRITGRYIYLEKKWKCCREFDRRKLAGSGHQQSSCSECPYWEYEVALEVDWGYDWACPSNPDIHCVSTLIHSHCNRIACYQKPNWFWQKQEECSKEELNGAYEESVQCAGFNNTLPYTDFDPKANPSDDKDWPAIIARGDCETCSVSLGLPSEGKMEKIKISGSVLSIAGASLLFLLLLYHICEALCCESRRASLGQRDRPEHLIKERLFTQKIENENAVKNVSSILRQRHQKKKDSKRGNISFGSSLVSSISSAFSQRPECAICLSNYEINETIAWSKNDACAHIFHEHCIVQWLKDHDDCPMCRTAMLVSHDSRDNISKEIPAEDHHIHNQMEGSIDMSV